MDVVEQIDLTVNPPQWRAIDRRNRVVCEPAPLIYYHPARDRDTVPESSTAMGSLHETGEVTSGVVPAAVAAERDEEDTVVPSEAVPTSIAEEGDLDPAKEKEIEDELLRELEIKRDVLDSELQARLGESLEALKGLTPEKRADGESHQDFEVRVKSWLTDMETRNPPLLSHAKILAEGPIDGSNRSDGLLEAFTCAKEKRKRLAKGAKDPPKTELLKKQLADFDVAKYLVDSTKEQREFYGKIQILLTELKAAVEEPMTLDPKILPELTTLVTDMNKLMEGQSSMQHHSLSTIQALTKQIEGIGWELHASSIDRRCIPRGTNHSGAWLRESLRETILCSRMALGELVEVTRANHEVLQQDHQIRKRNCEVNESMLQVLQRMEARDLAREKVEVEMARKQKEALQAQEAQKAKDKAAREQLLKDQQEKEAAEVRPGDVSDRSSPYDANSDGTTSDDDSNGSTDVTDPSSSSAHESQTPIPGRTYGAIEMVIGRAVR